LHFDFLFDTYLTFWYNTHPWKEKTTKGKHPNGNVGVSPARKIPLFWSPYALDFCSKSDQSFLSVLISVNLCQIIFKKKEQTMTTQAQIEANRQNAQKSTGPKTAAGKAKVSANALKHGLLADRFAIAEQDRSAFEAFRTRLLAELAPVGQMEMLLAGRIATLAWRLSLAERAQTGVLYVLTCKATRVIASTSSPLPLFNSPQAVEEYILGKTILSDFSDCKVLDRLAAYERRIERSLIAARKEFHQLQSLRQKADAKADNDTIAKKALPLPGKNAAQRRGGIEKDSPLQDIRQTNPIPKKTSMDYDSTPKPRIDSVIPSKEIPLIPSKQNLQTNPISMAAGSLIPYLEKT
jgi:hypothetical protein